MSTYGTMQTRIADELINESITTAQIQKAIQTAIAHYEREPWWFNQKVGTFSTVADQELYTATEFSDMANVVRIDSMLATSGSTDTKLRGVDYSTIEDVQDGSVSGDPTFYTRYADKIRLYPIPSSVMTMTVSYIYKLAALNADADTNAWVDECEELIRNQAKQTLCYDIIHAFDLGDRFDAQAKFAYDRLRNENRLRQPQPLLRTDWPFNRGYVNLEGAV